MKLSKVLSLVLAIAMLLSMPTFAAFTDVAADANYAEAVTVLSALDIINGYEDGSFKPEGKITRAEYAAIVCRVNNMDDAAKANANGNIFTDVAADHWASGYIATAYQAGIVNGMGDGTFAPEAEVTYEQAVKMLVAALGYEMKAQSMGGYPTGYMMIANQESITVGTTNTAGGASRATVARLTYNALTVPMMDQTSWGTDVAFEPIKTQSLLYTKLNAVKAEVTLPAIPLDKTATDLTNVTYIDFDGVTDANIAASNLSIQPSLKINGVDLTGLAGLTATAIIDKTDDSQLKLVCVVPKAGKNAEIVVNPKLMAEVSISSTDTYVEYYKTNDDDKTTKIKVPATGLATYKNLVSGTYATDVIVGGNPTDVAYRFVDTNNDGTYDTVFVDNEKVFVVGNVNTNSNKIFRATDTKVTPTFTAASLTLDPENEHLAWTIVDAEGNAMDIADIEAGSVVAVKESSDSSDTFYEITVSNEIVEGVIGEAYQETAKVGSVTLEKFKVGDADYVTLDNVALTPGDSIVAKIYNGKVVDYQIAEGVKNYGIVIAANRAEDFGVVYQLQVLTQKGEIVTLNLAEKVNDATPSYANTSDMYDAFKRGDILAYELNAAGEIKEYDVETGFTGGSSANVLESTDRMTTASGEYKASAERLDSYYITDETVIFATETGRGNTIVAPDTELLGKTNVALSSAEILNEDLTYNFAVLYNAEKEAKVVVLIKAANQIDNNSYPIVVTKVATVSVDNNRRTKLFGYVNGEEVEIIVAENADAAVGNLAVGDIALYAVNAAGEMNKAFELASKTATGFTVVDTAIAGAEDNTKDNSTANTVALSTTAITGVNTAALAQTTANGVMGTPASTANFKGFAAAGKAYRVQGGLLRLMNAVDYKATFDGTTTRKYDDGSTIEGRIEDYSVDAGAVAYLYNAKTQKYTVTTLLDAETDYTTFDNNNGAQLDNDDLVYVYNYDGETKLVLIVDVNGDN